MTSSCSVFLLPFHSLHMLAPNSLGDQPPFKAAVEQTPSAANQCTCAIQDFLLPIMGIATDTIYENLSLILADYFAEVVCIGLGKGLFTSVSRL